MGTAQMTGFFIEWLVLYRGPADGQFAVCGSCLGGMSFYMNSAFKNFFGPTALAVKVFTGSETSRTQSPAPGLPGQQEHDGAGIAGGVSWGLAEYEQGKWLKATVPESQVRIADIYFAKCLNAFHT